MASVPQASVEFARQRLGPLSGSAALLIGAGTTSELAARQLVKRGVAEVLILGRDPARATRLAQRHGGRVISAEGLGHALTKADVVISSTGAPHRIVHRDPLKEALANRHLGRAPLLLIDLAVPRNVDPAVVGLAGSRCALSTISTVSSSGPSCSAAASYPPRRPSCASRSPALRNGCGVVEICATATKSDPDVLRRCKAGVGGSPGGAGSTGAGSLRLRACEHLERDLSA